MTPRRFLDADALVNALDRAGVRKLLQHVGAVGEPAVAVASDTPEVAALLSSDDFAERVRALAARLGRDRADVRAEAAGYLREMAATHSEAAVKVWSSFGRWIMRAYDVVIDGEAARQLRRLDRQSSLIFLFSHRSYLDTWLGPGAVAESGVSPLWGMGGGNLNFFPFGTIASRTGVVFIRRSTGDLPVYRLALRCYIGQLIASGCNLGWSIEGGRTRTGKLRPPAYGILRYAVDAIESMAGAEAVIVPVSIVYDQLHEVGLMTAEATGGRKRPEDVRWLVNFARSQRQRLGRAYLDFGEPIRLGERLAELRAEDPEDPHRVERIALDTMHRINRATPVTTTAIVCLVLLAADRALTLDEVLATLGPIASYIERRGWAVAGAANLTDRATIRRALQDLVASGVLSSYDGGTATVWNLAPDRHLVAAFYRNTAIHILVNRAIGELALVAASESEDAAGTAAAESLRLRDLLKFDFFFPSRRDFAEEMRAELAAIDPGAVDRMSDFGRDEARKWLAGLHPLVAYFVLRPYLDAYHLVADRLAAWEDPQFDEERFLDDCLRVGRQWALQRKLASEESLSLELFRPALRLARHRDLVQSTAPELPRRRQEFADELRQTVRLVNRAARLAQPEDTLS